MLRYTIRRLLQGIPVLVGIVTITFFLTDAIPGDPVSIMLGPSPSQAEVEAIRTKYGLDQPLWLRYVNYLGDVSPIWLATTGSFPFVRPTFGIDLGRSLYYGVPVTRKIAERLPVTLYLLFSAFAFALATAVPLGVISAKRRNKPTDHVSRIVSLIGVSTPSFWIGLMMIVVFAFHLGWFPSTNLPLPWADPASVEGARTQVDVITTSLKHLLLPMVSLGTLQMAAFTRIERSSMLEVLSEDYVKLARAYGVSEGTILRKHAFRNAQLPLITIVGLNLTGAIGGAVLTETVFSINGMGRLIITAVYNQDYQLIMGTTLVFGFVFVVGVIVTDISYAYVDPRVSYGERE
ncbi:ABC transporter permease [Halobacteriales archaeon QS_5_70_17]|nr:MAG: ABC transporter permease [Halobacteriales archaeon QS_5_70_17]